MRRLGDLGRSIWDASHGKDGDLPDEREQRKSISRDRTFAENISCSSKDGRREMLATLSRLSQGNLLAPQGVPVCVERERASALPTSQIQHDRSLGRKTVSVRRIRTRTSCRSSSDCWKRPSRGGPRRSNSGTARLVGVKLGGLSAPASVTWLGEEEQVDQRASVYKVADEIRRRLGFDALSIGRSIESDAKRSRHVPTQADSSGPGKQQVNSPQEIDDVDDPEPLAASRPSDD